METSPKPYVLGAAVLFALQVVLVGAQLASGEPWAGFGEAGTLALGITWSLIWLLAAGGMPFHRKWGGAFGITGALISVVHGLLIVSAGAVPGVLYLGFGVVLLFLMKRALPWFGWSVFGEPAAAH
jgi:hypothetical protein